MFFSHFLLPNSLLISNRSARWCGQFIHAVDEIHQCEVQTSFQLVVGTNCVIFLTIEYPTKSASRRYLIRYWRRSFDECNYKFFLSVAFFLFGKTSLLKTKFEQEECICCWDDRGAMFGDDNHGFCFDSIVYITVGKEYELN